MPAKYLALYEDGDLIGQLPLPNPFSLTSKAPTTGVGSTSVRRRKLTELGAVGSANHQKHLALDGFMPHNRLPTYLPYLLAPRKVVLPCWPVILKIYLWACNPISYFPHAWMEKAKYTVSFNLVRLGILVPRCQSERVRATGEVMIHASYLGSEQAGDLLLAFEHQPYSPGIFESGFTF